MSLYKETDGNKEVALRKVNDYLTEKLYPETEASFESVTTEKRKRYNRALRAKELLDNLVATKKVSKGIVESFEGYFGRDEFIADYREKYPLGTHTEAPSSINAPEATAAVAEATQREVWSYMTYSMKHLAMAFMVRWKSLQVAQIENLRLSVLNKSLATMDTFLKDSSEANEELRVELKRLRGITNIRLDKVLLEREIDALLNHVVYDNIFKTAFTSIPDVLASVLYSLKESVLDPTINGTEPKPNGEKLRIVRGMVKSIKRELAELYVGDTPNVSLEKIIDVPALNSALGSTVSSRANDAPGRVIPTLLPRVISNAYPLAVDGNLLDVCYTLDKLATSLLSYREEFVKLAKSSGSISAKVIDELTEYEVILNDVLNLTNCITDLVNVRHEAAVKILRELDVELRAARDLYELHSAKLAVKDSAHLDKLIESL